MISKEGSGVQKVLSFIQAIVDVCREDKHAYLKAVCAFAQQRINDEATPDEKANLLFCPLRIAATLQSKSEQRFFVFAAQGISALLFTQLVTASTPFLPPAIPHTERKLGFFGKRDVSMQQLDAADNAAEDSSLVEAIVSTIELRTSLLCRSSFFSVHTAAENTVFTEHLKSLSMLMREKRFSVEGRKWLQCFKTALLCCSELKPFDSKNDVPLSEVFPSILSTVLRRAQTVEAGVASGSQEDVAVLDGAEKSTDDAMKAAQLCAMLLDLLSTSPKEPREGSLREDYLQYNLNFTIRLSIMAFFFEEASDSLCKWPPVVQRVAKKVCPCILQLIVSKDTDVCSHALAVLQALVQRHGHLLKSKVVYYVHGVLLPLLECDQTTAEKKEEILLFLKRVLRCPAVLAEWFVNFDGRVGAVCMMEQLLKRLGKMRFLRGDTSPNKKLTRGLYEVFFASAQSMRALLDLKVEDTTEPSSPFSPLVSQPPPELESSALMHKMLAQKQTYKRGIVLFNESREYKAAIDTLAGIRGFMDNTSPYAVAQLLLTCEDLNPTEIGSFLSRCDPETTAVLKAFIDLHDFSGMVIDEAVRLFLGSFRIAREAETVDRTMEAFAEVYCQQNPGTLTKPTACVLAFSVVMLNTDAHSTQVKNKMTEEQYVKNLRGTEVGKNFSPAFLANIYRRVVKQEIKPWRQFPAYLLVTRSTSGSQTDLHLMDNALELVAKDVRAEKYVAAVHTAAIAGAICDCSWNTFLPAFSLPLEESQEREVIDACLKGFADCIAVMCRQGRMPELKAFLSALRAFSHLTGLRTMEHKNVSAATMLIKAAHEYPNELMEGWEEVMRCISWIGRQAAVELLIDRHRLPGKATSILPDIVATAGRAGDAGASPAGGSGGGGLVRAGSRQHVDFMDANTIEATGRENAATLFQHISKQTIHFIFTHSHQALHDDALVAMVRCLCKVCSEETASQPPSTFMFRYLLDVLEVNFDRTLNVWRQLWAMSSSQMHLVITTSKVEAQAVFAFKALRKYTLAQLRDKEIGSDKAIVTAVFELYQSISEKCECASVVESMTSTLAQLVRLHANRLGPGWPAAITTLTNCFERFPEVRVRIAATLHEVSTRCFPKLCRHADYVARLFRAWGSVAREDASLEGYALWHIRLLIASLFHVDNPRGLERATLLQRQAVPNEEHPAPAASGAVLPSIPVLGSAVRFLDEDVTGGAPLPFGLCTMGCNELVSLAADFHAPLSLTEGALDMLLDASAVFRKRVKAHAFSPGAAGRSRGQGQWEQLYSQCVLNLLDVYVDACLFPEAEASAPGGTREPNAPSSNDAVGGAGAVKSSSSPTAAGTSAARMTPPARGRPGAADRKPGKGSSSTSRQRRTPERVSEMALGLLEKLVSLLVKQELILREEDHDGESVGRESSSHGQPDVDGRPGAAARGPAASPQDPPPMPTVPSDAMMMVETAGEVVDIDAETSPATSAAAPSEVPLSPLGSESLGLLTGDDASTTAARRSSHLGEGNPLHPNDLADGRGEEEEEEEPENVLDEGRRDRIAEVNLNLVRRLLEGLCACPHDKIRNLGFLALRKLISSRLEGTVTATNQAEMTELSKQLNSSLQAFFQEHVVNRCLLRPPHSTPPLGGGCDGSGGGRRLASWYDSGAAGDEDPAVRLPSEAVLQACIHYVDLLCMVMQQEVPVISLETLDTDSANAGDRGYDGESCASLVPLLQRKFEGLLDDATTAEILRDFRGNYDASSRVLSLDFFSTLSQTDGRFRAAGERVLAMIITFECSISNVFIEMEGSWESMTASQLASPNTNTVDFPDRAAFSTRMPSLAGMSGPDVPPGVAAVLSSVREHPVPPATVGVAALSSLPGAGSRHPVQVELERFRGFVLSAFLEASRQSKKDHCPSSAASSMANQQQLLATRTVVRSFLESLQRAPTKVVRRLMPKYCVELCELIKSCDEEIAPILSEILLRYLSNT